MIKIFSSVQEINQDAASRFVRAAHDAITTKGSFTVALTGGSSPQGLYKLLSEQDYQQQVDWSKVIVFWGDERWVPLDNDLSNAKMSFETLLHHVPIPAENVHPMYQEGVAPEAFAHAYETLLNEKLGADGVFDLILLGMGNDGHTASLFPGTSVLDEQDKWVSAYYLEAQEMYRVTLTAPILNRARQVLVIAFGQGKAEALKQVLEGEFNPARYPAQLLQHRGEGLVYLVDKEAAKFLDGKN